MNAFTASNGDQFTVGSAGGLDISGRWGSGVYLSPALVKSVREFFQAEADERLGRWRYDRETVVYAGSGSVRVLNEQGGHVTNEFHRTHFTEPEGELSTVFRLAARAYFDAHPEPKPWHDAKPGEIWVVRMTTGPTFSIEPMRVEDEGGVRFSPVESEGHDRTFSVRDACVEDARRIWPEVSS